MNRPDRKPGRQPRQITVTETNSPDAGQAEAFARLLLERERDRLAHTAPASSGAAKMSNGRGNA